MADFDCRIGTSSTHGTDYEDQMITYLAVAACNENLKDFWIATNVDGVGAWDDIILYTEAIDGEKKLFLFQLKHKENPEKNKFTIKDVQDKALFGKTKNPTKSALDIPKYFEGYEDIQQLLSNPKPKRFLQSKAFLESTEVPFENMEFVFMTNTSVTSDNKSQLNFKIAFFNTNTAAEIYQIDNTTIQNDSQSNFLKQFFIYANQLSVHNDALKNTICRELQKYIKNQDFEYYSNVAENLQLHIKNEFVERGRKLTLPDVQEIISICTLSCFKYRKDVHAKYLSLNAEERDTFQKLIEQYKLVLLSEDNVIPDFFFNLDVSCYFIACKDIFNNLVIDCLKIVKKKKIIWFHSKTTINRTVETLVNTNILIKNQIKTLYSLKDLPEESLALLSEYCIRFQGRETKFRTLLKSNPCIKNIFNIDDILSLLTNQLNIGNEICETPKYYVSRSIPRIFINKSIILKLPKSFFILLVKDDSEYETLTVQSFWGTTSRNMSSNMSMSMSSNETMSIEQTRNNETIETNWLVVKYDSVSEKLINVKSKFAAVHILKYYKYKDDFVLEYISSTTNIYELKNFIEKEQFDIEPIGDNLTDMHWSYKIGMLIVANPGMGKTYFTKHLANIFPVNSIFWTVFISLNELNFEAVNNFQTCIMDYQTKLNNKDKEIFNSYLENRSVVILFDGFDEIAPTNVEEALRIIKEGYELELKIVVTSREVTRELLEANLNLLSYTLEPFTRNNKLQFLETYFLDNIRKPDTLVANAFEDKIKQFSRNLIEACSLSNWDEDFTGIPLQCKLLAVGFKNECQHYCQTGEERVIKNKINLITLYENFIETKFNICIQEKEKIEAKVDVKNKFIKSRKAEFLENHINAAVQIIFPQAGIKILEEFSKEIKNGEDKFGLITKIENNNPVFLHRTFAEYFAAKWLVNIKERKTEVDESKRGEYLKFLLEPQYNVVHDLFDKLICIDCELHIAVLNGNTTNIKEILEKNEGRDEGKCGRTALHLLAARGARHEREDGRIERKGEEKYAETLKVLLENSVCCDEADELFRSTPQQFSNHRNAFGVIDLLLGNKKNELYSLENTFIEKWNKNEILNMCAEYNYVNIGITFVNLKELELKTTKELLKICTDNDSFQFAEKLIHYKDLNSDILSKVMCKYGVWYENGTLLHIAAQKGNMKILTLLLQYIVDVDIKDKDGRTALWFACSAGHLSSVKTLLERNAQLFLKDNEGWTPMDEAVWSENGELVKYVTSYDILKIGFGDDVNAVLPSNWKGSTALHFGVMGNNLLTIEKLISTEANVKITKEAQWTALHWAFQKRNLSTVKKLVESGVNLSLTNNEGKTPIDIAFISGNKETVEFVTSYDVLKVAFGEYVNAVVDKWGCTALHFAVLGNNLSTIERLINEGANVNATNKKEWTALHCAFELKNWSTVKKLVKNGGNLFLTNRQGQAPMEMALNSGNEEIVKFVTSYDVLKIEFGEDVNAELTGRGNGSTALYFATLGNNLSAVEKLISNGANVNITDEDGNTILHTIFKKKWINKNIMEFLVESDLNINAQNNKRETALHLAVKERNTKLVKLLLDLGANPNIMNKKQRTALSIAREEGEDETFLILFENTQIISERDKLNKSVITNGENVETRRATFVGYPEELATLIDSLIKCGFYYYGLNDAVRCFKCRHDLKNWCSSHDPSIRHAIKNPKCEFLIQEKGQQFIQTYKRGSKGETLLHWECRRENLSAVKDLVQKGASIFLEDTYVFLDTPIDLAIKSNNRELIEYVTSYDVLRIGFREDVNAVVGTNDRTALHYAARGNNLPTIERLISEKANVNITDGDKMTALHWSCKFKEEEFDTTIVRRLIKSGANINAQARSGRTPLHWVAYRGNKLGVALLFELGANGNIVDYKERTALSVAREWKNDEVFLILFEKTEVISERDALHKSVLTNGDDLEVRRATFIGFPPELAGIVDSLSQSGFYYNGIKDDVRCFQCGEVLRNLEPTADPWFEHARYKPDCEFLLREKGLEFIQSCEQRLNVLNRKKGIVEKLNQLIDSVKKSGDRSKLNAKNNEGQTALHSAAWLGSTEIAKSLLELGADPNIVDNEQRTPRSVAREEGEDETFLILFVRTKVRSKRDALHKSVLTNGDDVEVRKATFVDFPQQLSGIVDSLSQAGFYYYGIRDKVRCFHCDFKVCNWPPTNDPWVVHAIYKPECKFLNQKKEPEFMQACQRYWNRIKHRGSEKPITEKVNRLIESAMKSGEMSDVNINAQNNEGQTALHSAAWLGNVEMVKSLLELGANANIVDNKQRTALSVAREEQKDETFMLLYERTEVLSDRDLFHLHVLLEGNDEEVRRATFVGFPKELPGIDLISQAGFYYFGIEDYVRCFRCDLGLMFWEPSDDPWFQHAKFKPECEFLIREKGIEFIQSCQPENETESYLSKIYKTCTIM